MAKKKGKKKGKKKKAAGPKLSKEEKKLLELRNQMSGKRPDFKRQEWFRYKRLGDSWRKPRGLHSKKRKGKKYRGKKVKIGFRGPTAVRGLHPSGYREVRVFNPAEMEDLDPKIEAARIGGSVGIRKRLLMEKKAKKLGVKVLNPLHIEEKEESEEAEE